MNIIVIEADQLSAQWLGCYGNQAAHTPHLDRLAAQGIRFENCFANHPVCMPSRASAITGRSAQHHGLYYNGWELGLDLPTFPQVLKDRGIQTLGVGKFHLECHGRSAYNDVRKYGFDRAEVTEDIRAGDWLDWVESTDEEFYEQALATVWHEEHLSCYGPLSRNLNEEIKRAKAIHQPRICAPMTYASIVPEHICQTRWTVDRAIAFLKERDKARPFFLKVSFVDPHDPYDPPERYVNLIDTAKVTAPVCSDDAALQEVLNPFRTIDFVSGLQDVSQEQWKVMRQYYFGSVAFIDEQIGRLLAHMQESGLDKETAIIFTADHGDMLGDHNLPTKGAWHFDACIRIPLLISGPGIPAGGHKKQIVTNLDLFPTILEMAEITAAVPLEGSSLLSLTTRGSSLNRPNAALVETYGSYGNLDSELHARTIVTEHARLTLFGNQTGMLFDLQDDPHETHNLFSCVQAKGLQSNLKDTMLNLLARQNSLLPNRNRHPFALH